MSKYKLLFVLLFSVFCILPTILFSQVGTAWVARYNGPGNSYDEAYAVTVDGSANVYVTGASRVGSVTSGDYTTIKYNSAGVQQWVQTYNGPGNSWDEAYAIAVDGSANVYVTGYSWGTSQDYATIKYNSTGVQQWVQRYNGLGNREDYAYVIAVDGAGNVYVTGKSYGWGTNNDYATIKYNSAGVQQWVQTYNGPGNIWDGAFAIAVDGSGNVYVTGYSYGSGTDDDYATIKYDSAGVQQWVQRYNGPGNSWDEARAIAVDGSANVYVTGYSWGLVTSLDYATIKYNSAGVQQWVQRYNGLGNDDDYARAIVVDGSANVYVTGYSWGTSQDYATIKYVQSQGVEENRIPLFANRYALEIFPNPARNYFTIRLPQSNDRSEVKIFDVTGKVIREVRCKTKEVRISTEGIRNGVYFIKVGDEMVKEKMIVMK